MSIAASSSRPGIHIDGVLHAALSQDLLGFTIEDAVSSPARCLARFANVGGNGNQASGYKYFALDAFDFGRRLTVWQGVPPATLVRLFEGRIVLIEGVYAAGGAPEVLVQAEDRLWDLRMTRRTRVFEHMTDADMIQTVAAEHGLEASVHLNGSQSTHAHTAQLHQSDYAFLFDRVTAAGAQMWIEQNTLVVTDAAQPGDPAELVYGDGLVHFRVRADVRRQATVSGVSGWDVYGKQAIGGSASDEDLPSDEMDASSGGRTLEVAFGHKRHAIVDAVPGSDDEAASLAVAYHRQQAAEFIVGHGLAVAAPGLRAGRAIDIQGLGPLFSGRYHITRVRHVFDLEHGLRAEFDVRRARLGANVHDSKPRETAHANRHPRPTEDSGSRHREAPKSAEPGTGRRTKGA
jgi:phage protein D